MVHEYRRFIQSELDARGWDAAELVRRSGLRRQLVWKILHDDRDTLGQLPDRTTLDALAHGLSIPVERLRVAATRSLDGYDSGGIPVAHDVKEFPTEVLLEELRRRIPSVPNKPKDAPNWGRRGVGAGSSFDDPGVRRDKKSL